MSNKQQTTAEQIAEMFDNDGMCFERDGQRIEDVCDSYCVDCDRRADSVRFDFGDGSIIIIAGDAWDEGIVGSSSDCHCWQSSYYGEHLPDCTDDMTIHSLLGDEDWELDSLVDERADYAAEDIVVRLLRAAGEIVPHSVHERLSRELQELLDNHIAKQEGEKGEEQQ